MTQSKSSQKPSTSTIIKQRFEKTQIDDILKSIREVIPLVKDNDPLINNINNIREEVLKGGTIDLESLKNMIRSYETIEQRVINEEKLLRESLEMINEIRNKRYQEVKPVLHPRSSVKSTSSIIPVRVPRSDKEPPPMCGTIKPHSSDVAKCGDLVAALVEQSDTQTWIMAEIVQLKCKGYYEVEGIDIKETNLSFIVAKHNIKPLPLMKDDPVTCPDAFFASGQFVLAMYPYSTRFYKALVKSPPKSRSDGYEVFFADRFYKYTMLKVVSQRFVISLP